jgi:uncharacterized protein (DUF433 family)
MATQTYRIVSSEESTVHGEPHIEGSRITVRYVHERVEERGLRPETVADRHGLDVADVYEALAYFHNNPEEMTQVEERHERAVEEAKRRSTLTPPEE